MALGSKPKSAGWPLGANSGRPPRVGERVQIDPPPFAAESQMPDADQGRMKTRRRTQLIQISRRPNSPSALPPLSWATSLAALFVHKRGFS